MSTAGYTESFVGGSSDGKSGFKVFRFELRKIGSDAEAEMADQPCQSPEDNFRIKWSDM